MQRKLFDLTSSYTSLARKHWNQNLDIEDMCDQILCFYKNQTNQLQIARISNVATLHFEQVVFSGEQILFEALPEAELEIDIKTASDLIVTQTIACSDLQILN